MIAEELERILKTAGWSVRSARGEVALEVCYFCGNDRFNLECSPEKGVYHCWACRKGGRLSDLLKSLTGQQHDIQVQKGAAKQKKTVTPQTTADFKSSPIAAVESAARYLDRRGITAEVAAQYGVVVCMEPEHRLYGRIAFQMKDFWTRELVGWVGRSYTGKIPKYISTLEHKVITGWRTRDKDSTAVVVEGPLDGLTVHRAGFQSAVLSGVGGAGVVEWASRLPLKTPVAIMLDADALVQAQRLYWQLSPILGERAFIVHFSSATDDPTEVGPEGVRHLIDQALRDRGHTFA